MSIITLITSNLGYAFVIIFVLLILAFWIRDSSLDKGEIRRSITITFIVMYILLVFLSLDPNPILNFEDNEFLTNFHKAILVVLALYFGSRAYETALGTKGTKTRIVDLATEIFEIDTPEDKETDELKKEMKATLDKMTEGDLKTKIKKIIDME